VGYELSQDARLLGQVAASLKASGTGTRHGRRRAGVGQTPACGGAHLLDDKAPDGRSLPSCRLRPATEMPSDLASAESKRCRLEPPCAQCGPLSAWSRLSVRKALHGRTPSMAGLRPHLTDHMVVDVGDEEAAVGSHRDSDWTAELGVVAGPSSPL
jgi:hypothetical protein